jgi:PAS domain S-box-containing protein
MGFHMKYDIEKRDELVKEQAPAEAAGKEAVPPERQCEERVRYLEAILQDMGDAVIVADRSGNIAYMNAAAREMFGLRTPEEGSRYFRDTGRYEYLDEAGRTLPPESWPLSRAMRGETFRDQEVTFKDKSTGRLIRGVYNVAPLKDAGVPGMNVITVQPREARKGTLSVAPGLLPLLGLIAASIPETIMATGCDILLYDERDGIFRSASGSTEWQRTVTEKMAYCASEEDKATYARRVMESRVPLVVEGTKDHPLCTAPGSAGKKLGVKSLVVLPLIDKGRFLGSMIIDSTLDRHKLGDRDMDILDAVAKLAAVMIRRAESAPVAAPA